MKVKTPTRHNFSRYAKLCDHNLYHDSKPNYDGPKGYVSPEAKKPKKSNQNYFFKSISREKRGNFRFDIQERKGDFIYYPDHNFGKSRSPSWMFPKQEKYQNQKFVEYEFCQKHPLMKQNQQAKIKSTQSMKSFVKDRIRLSKSISMTSTNADLEKNYSIINPRQTSPTGFFHQSKIKATRYLSKGDLCHFEADEDFKKYTRRLSTGQKGLIDFKKQLKRKPNVVRKSFEYFEKSYDHEKQFNNFSMTKYPIKPEHHIDFSQHLKRAEIHNKQRLGPNPEVVEINFTRPKDNNMNYNISTFRDKIRTRYDRIQPEPNTRLDIELPEPKSKGMVPMEKVLSRSKDLFPIVDPILKKPGDKEMTEQLRKATFKFEINQALKPVNPDLSTRKVIS